MHQLILRIALLASILTPVLCVADDYQAQRKLFIKAEAALKAGRSGNFQRLKAKLGEYPLYSYLEYWQLNKRLGNAKDSDVEAFLHRYHDQPVAQRLRTRWLHLLGKRRNWKAYRKFYQPQRSVTLQCYKLRADFAQGDKGQALKDALALWRVGYSQPAACDPIFDQLYASPLIDSQRIWERIRLAFANQKSSLAVYLAKRLSADDREWVKRWQYAHRRPTAAIAERWAQQDTPLVREILTHAIVRLARHKPDQAWKHWHKLAQTHRFSDDQKGTALRRIGLSGALDNHQDAALWLAHVPESHADESIRQWRVRVTLAEQDWESALHWLDELTQSERNDDPWRYWRAYVLEKNGNTGDAMTQFAALSGTRSYYGFLAADRLKRPYQMNDARLRYDKQTLQAVENLPGITRARELYLAGKRTDARREWFYVTQTLDEQSLKLAALLAHRWGWHDRAILTASKAKYWSDLTLRFPLAHRESIFSHATRYDLDPAFIYGVIRQESAFMDDARSSVGALGLMQLMPNTGKQTAQSLNFRYRGRQTLLKSDHNIRLGSAYLRKLLNRFNGSPVLAAAAYNAGPHRVDRWLPRDADMEAPLWIEHIPFTETRGYVRRVLAYATVFDWRLERPVTRLSRRLPQVRQRY